jgi:GNAT superfamily N-acetyltransferase
MAKLVVEKRHTAAKKAVLRGLMAFNRRAHSYVTGRLVSVTLRGDDDAIIGGATGYSRGPTAFLELLWIEDQHKGKGTGTTLLAAFEEECRKQGARQIYLDTYSFQAKPFYEKNGYHELGRIEGYFEGVARHWMIKAL